MFVTRLWRFENGWVVLADVEAKPGFVSWSRMSALGALGLLEGNGCLANWDPRAGALDSYALLALANIVSTRIEAGGLWV